MQQCLVTAHKASQKVLALHHDMLLLLQDLLGKCVQHTDFKTMPSQVLCLAAALTFTQQAEQAITNGTLAQLQVSADNLSTCAALHHHNAYRFSCSWLTQLAWLNTVAAKMSHTIPVAICSSRGTSTHLSLPIAGESSTAVGRICCSQLGGIPCHAAESSSSGTAVHLHDSPQLACSHERRSTQCDALFLTHIF